MTALLFVLAAATGGVARWAALRWWHCGWQALLAVNAVGSGILGVLVGRGASDAALVVIGTAFAGSLTTFSSFVLEVARSRPLWAATQVGMQLLVCLGVASAALVW